MLSVKRSTLINLNHTRDVSSVSVSRTCDRRKKRTASIHSQSVMRRLPNEWYQQNEQQTVNRKCLARCLALLIRSWQVHPSGSSAEGAAYTHPFPVHVSVSLVQQSTEKVRRCSDAVIRKKLLYKHCIHVEMITTCLHLRLKYLKGHGRL